ncbi:MAG: hypothetical protein CMA10_00065 [Euryarchaeota archaeon]|nr:hypothetical protein [Euryarchaeota archaeon]|tara:strand:- start:6160 stop:7107 length:948 start_codon:yes stop_codon:yes gene_type:complete
MNDTLISVFVMFVFILPGCTTGSFSSSSSTEDSSNPEQVCNGLSELCSRTYDDVTFPETHNAFATHEDGIIYPASNHQTGLYAQWNAGIRAFMIDTHYENLNDESQGTVRLCHGDDDRGTSPCVYGSVNALAWLTNLAELMAQHENDIVTLLVENYVQPEHLEDVFTESGLMGHVFVHEINTAWPTLDEMIQSETRLVVFWEQSADTGHPWVHDFLTHSWTTNYAEENTEDMNCDVLRGDSEQSVFHMNNWLSGPLGLSDPSRGDEANNPDFLISRAKDCWEQHGKRPTFVAVDWWEDGDVIAAVQAINQMNEWD